MSQIKNEELRIRETYARRDAAGKPALYTWDRMDSVYMAYRRKVAWIKALKEAGFRGLPGLDILDIGCGAGGWLRMMSEWGADPGRLHGLDLLEDRIARAKALSPAAMDFKVGNAMELDFPDSSMDLCAASTVFSSILDGAVRMALAREMARMVRPGGWVMIFDYAVSHPRNPDTIGIRKKEIIRLFPHLKLLHTFKLIFPPPLLRLLPAKLLGLAHFWEDILPLTCTHRLYVLKQP
ncbi:MAG: class I SAM-dependent methyltransferase [Desulfobaccales bacterium]